MTSQDQPARYSKSKVGTVRSISGHMTVNVAVSTLTKHARYGKYVRRRTNVAVHDPAGAAAVGDVVEIVPCRRLSKTKAWRLVRVVRPALAEVAGGDR